jgi:hypothetical protein
MYIQENDGMRSFVRRERGLLHRSGDSRDTSTGEPLDLRIGERVSQDSAESD